MKQISIGDLVSRAWDLAVKHWPIFVLLSIISGICGSLYSGDSSALAALGQHPDPEEIFEALSYSFNPGKTFFGMLLSTYVGLITYRMLVNAVNTGKPYEALSEVLRVDLIKYALFLGVLILMGACLVFGYALCIIPGLFLTVHWMFVPLIAATEDVSVGEAFGRSWQLTKGHFWKLIGLLLAEIGIAIVGFCACFVGIFFAEVIIEFANVLAYNDLKGQDAPAADFVGVQ